MQYASCIPSHKNVLNQILEIYGLLNIDNTNDRLRIVAKRISELSNRVQIRGKRLHPYPFLNFCSDWIDVILAKNTMDWDVIVFSKNAHFSADLGKS